MIPAGQLHLCMLSPLHLQKPLGQELDLVRPSFLPSVPTVAFLWTNLTNFPINRTSHSVSGYHYSSSTVPGIPVQFHHGSHSSVEPTHCCHHYCRFSVPFTFLSSSSTATKTYRISADPYDSLRPYRGFAWSVSQFIPPSPGRLMSSRILIAYLLYDNPSLLAQWLMSNFFFIRAPSAVILTESISS